MSKDFNSPAICLITGATSGIGKATAIALAEKGYSIAIVGRDTGQCESTMLEINTVLHSNAQSVYFVGDLSSLKAVRRIAEEIEKKFSCIDVLVNNVGARFMKYIESDDSFEMSFALNHLSGFLLTHLLVDKLKASGTGRVINLTSGAHAKSIDLDWLMKPVPYDGRKAYSQSKLCNLLFTIELSRRVKESGISVNAIDPGGTATNFNRNNGLLYWIRHLVAHTVSGDLVGPKKGADTIVFLASSTEISGVTGKYFKNRVADESFPRVHCHSDAGKLWRLSEKLVGISPT